MSDAGMTTDASEAPAPSTPPIHHKDRPHRRHRPPRGEVPDYTSGHESETTNGNLTDSSVQAEHRSGGRESMAERMQRRRKSQVNMEEIQNNLSKIELLRQRNKSDESEADVKHGNRVERRVRHHEAVRIICFALYIANSFSCHFLSPSIRPSRLSVCCVPSIRVCLSCMD